MSLFKAVHVPPGEPPMPPVPDRNNPIPMPPPADIPPADDDPEGIPGQDPEEDVPKPGSNEVPIRDPQRYEPLKKVGMVFIHPHAVASCAMSLGWMGISTEIVALPERL